MKIIIVQFRQDYFEDRKYIYYFLYQQGKCTYLACRLVVYRVSKSRFRVGSGYHKLGFGSGTGITLLFEPRYRVPSGNIRVSESLENLSKMIILFYFCEQVFEKSSKLPAISFSFKAKTFLKKIYGNFFLKINIF